MLKLIYIASPFTYRARNADLKRCMERTRYERVTEITAKLISKYNIAPIGPITMSYQFNKYMPELGESSGTFDKWSVIDYTYITNCDEVWVITMAGWQESTGVQTEIKYAMLNNIPVRYVDENKLEVWDNPSLLDFWANNE